MERDMHASEDWKQMREELGQIVDLSLERIREAYAASEVPRTLEAREKMALALAKDIAEYLLEKDILFDPMLPMEELTRPCPSCGRSCTPSKDKDGIYKKAQVTIETSVGRLPLTAPIFRCASCRRDFSPLTQRAAHRE